MESENMPEAFPSHSAQHLLPVHVACLLFLQLCTLLRGLGGVHTAASLGGDFIVLSLYTLEYQYFSFQQKWRDSVNKHYT